MATKDYYESLGVARDAAADDIQRAYRKLARKYHPDVNQANGAEDRFKEISEAYEILKDPERRQLYDRYGHAGPAGAGGVPPGFEGFGGGDGGFGSLFDNLFGGRGFDPFGGGGGPRRGRPSRGRDHEARIVLTLEEAAAGGEREVTITDPMSGRSRTHRVKLPAGVRPGQKIRVPGRGGDSDRGGPAGDLFLVVELRTHPRFRLEEKDLHTTVAIAPWEAALGGQVKVPTLTGPVTIRIPAGASSGRRIRLRSKGFPTRKGHGDLFVELKIVVPETLSDQERALFEELEKVSSFRPR